MPKASKINENERFKKVYELKLDNEKFMHKYNIL